MARMKSATLMAMMVGCGSIALAHAQAVNDAPAGAPTLTDWFDQAKVTGTVRSFYFDRMYGAPGVSNQSAYSLAGILNVQSAPFLDGFEVGTSFFTAQSLSANNTEGAPGYPHLDATLMGPATPSRRSVRPTSSTRTNWSWSASATSCSTPPG